jgi:hypothetical protein
MPRTRLGVSRRFMHLERMRTKLLAQHVNFILQLRTLMREG